MSLPGRTCTPWWRPGRLHQRNVPVNLIRYLLEVPVLQRRFPFICPYGAAAWGWFGIRVNKDFIIDSVAGMLWAAPVLGLAAVPVWDGLRRVCWTRNPKALVGAMGKRTRLPVALADTPAKTRASGYACPWQPAHSTTQSPLYSTTCAVWLAHRLTADLLGARHPPKPDGGRIGHALPRRCHAVAGNSRLFWDVDSASAGDRAAAARRHPSLDHPDDVFGTNWHPAWRRRPLWEVRHGHIVAGERPNQGGIRMKEEHPGAK